MKKFLTVFLLVSLLAAVFSSCKITPYQPAESSQQEESSAETSKPSELDTDDAAVVYGDAVIGKRLFKLVAALQKGIAEYAYKLAADIDFEAHPEYWDYEYDDGVTFAEATLQAAVDRCKELAVMKQLCDKAGIAEPSDESKEAYADKLAENYDSRADFEKALSDIGVTVEEVYEYYAICARAIELKEKLTGEGGALELSQHDADVWFKEYVEQNYVKADVLFIGFYADDGKTKVIDDSFTDSDAAEYFVKNYIKCRYIKYSKSAEALADACLSDLESGKATFEQKLGESSDTESVKLLVHGDALYDDVAAVEIGKYAKIVSGDDIYIILRSEPSKSDMTTAIKNNCLWHLTCEKLTEDSEPLLDDIKNGRVEYSSSPMGVYLGDIVFDREAYGEELFGDIRYDLLVGECDVTCTENGIYIYTKRDVTGSCDDKRDEAVAQHITELFDEHIASFTDSTEVFDTVTDSVKIKELAFILFV